MIISLFLEFSYLNISSLKTSTSASIKTSITWTPDLLLLLLQEVREEAQTDGDLLHQDQPPPPWNSSWRGNLSLAGGSWTLTAIHHPDWSWASVLQVYLKYKPTLPPIQTQISYITFVFLISTDSCNVWAIGNIGNIDACLFLRLEICILLLHKTLIQTFISTHKKKMQQLKMYQEV